MPPDNIPHKPCPICGKPLHLRFRPFCSRRCSDVDLNRWLAEGYRVPANDDTDDRKVTLAPDDDAGV